MAQLRAELVQAAAVAIAWIEELGQRRRPPEAVTRWRMAESVAPCGSPAIFAPNGDRDRSHVYRCENEASHDGWHHAEGVSWDEKYPPLSAERIRAVEAGERDPL